MKRTAINICYFGFTLIELLLVLTILTILATLVVGSLNPARQLAIARDAERESDLFTIMNALHQYAVDHEGAFPEVIESEEFPICRTGAETCVGRYDLSVLTDADRYLVEIPIDPLCENDTEEVFCDATDSGYIVGKTENGRIIMYANRAELRRIEIVR